MENNVKDILQPKQNEGKKIKVGIIGLGTVGSGVFKTLRYFKNIEVAGIAVKILISQEILKGWMCQ